MGSSISDIQGSFFFFFLASSDIESRDKNRRCWFDLSLQVTQFIFQISIDFFCESYLGQFGPDGEENL